MTADEAYETLLATGIADDAFAELQRRKINEVMMTVSHVDSGERDQLEFDLLPGMVVALAEESERLHDCASAPEVHALAFRHLVLAFSNGGYEAVVECFKRAFDRAKELELRRLERTWHERAWRKN